MEWRNKYFIGGIIYIGIWIIGSVSLIGKISSCEPYSWTVPFDIGAVLLVPFILGLWAGGNKE